MSEGFSKGFRRALDEDPSKTLPKPFENPSETLSEGPSIFGGGFTQFGVFGAFLLHFPRKTEDKGQLGWGGGVRNRP